MHECWQCGAYCWCDMDDTMLDQPKDCRHTCPDDSDLDGYDDLDGWVLNEDDKDVGGGES